MRQLLPALHYHSHHHSHNSPHSSPKVSASHGISPRSSRQASPVVSHPGTPSLTPVITSHSLHGGLNGKQPVKPPLELLFRIESPPIILYGQANDSTGALLSGLFDVRVNQDHPIPLESVSLSVCQIIDTHELPEKEKKKSRVATNGRTATATGATPTQNGSTTGPAPHIGFKTPATSSSTAHSTISSNFDHLGRVPACPQCAHYVNELATWDVLNHQADLPMGTHGYPFSYLLPGSLPATSSTLLFSIRYVLRAVAVPSDPTVRKFVSEIPVKVSRAIIQGADKTSVRVFPPTTLTATMVMPSVVHPRSTFTFDLSLEGVTSTSKVASGSTSSETSNSSTNAPATRPQTNRTISAPSPAALPTVDVRPSLSRNHESTRPDHEARAGSRNGSPALAPSASETSQPQHHCSYSAEDPRRPRWRMRKINWRIDETIRMKPILCQAHSQASRTYRTMTPIAAALETTETVNVPQVPSEQQQSAVPNRSGNDTGPGSTSPRNSSEAAPGPSKPSGPVEPLVFSRTLDSGEIKSGWKSDFSGMGRIQLQSHEMSTHKLQNICCNIDDPVFGLMVTHTFVLELVISEEAFPHRAAKHTVPTGSARVLRMQFNLIVTDHSGLGIAWDDEVPPVYADVPLSPPDYDMVAKLPTFEELLPMAVSLSGINSQINLNSSCSSSASSVAEQASNNSTH